MISAWPLVQFIIWAREVSQHFVWRKRMINLPAELGPLAGLFQTFTLLSCTALHCTVLCCTILCSTALYCTLLRCTSLHCTVLCCTALHCTALHRTVLCCTALSSTRQVPVSEPQGGPAGGPHLRPPALLLPHPQEGGRGPEEESLLNLPLPLPQWPNRGAWCLPQVWATRNRNPNFSLP